MTTFRSVTPTSAGPATIAALALAVAAAATAPGSARAAESFDNCIGEIATLPAVISTQGTWCLEADLSTSSSSGNAITIATNNVIIDCNGFKLGNLPAGQGTAAMGIYADSRSNITIRGCNIRGFNHAIALVGSGGGHLVEGNRIDGATERGILVAGGNSTVRGNQLIGIGPATDEEAVATGIEVWDGGDVAGNNLSGITSPGAESAVGIQMISGTGSTIRDNIIRGLSAPGSQGFGIALFVSTVSVRGNDLVGGAGDGSVGVLCVQPDVVLRDNVIGGFETNIAAACESSLDDVTY